MFFHQIDWMTPEERKRPLQVRTESAGDVLSHQRRHSPGG